MKSQNDYEEFEDNIRQYYSNKQFEFNEEHLILFEDLLDKKKKRKRRLILFLLPLALLIGGSILFINHRQPNLNDQPSYTQPIAENKATEAPKAQVESAIVDSDKSQNVFAEKPKATASEASKKIITSSLTMNMVSQNSKNNLILSDNKTRTETNTELTENNKIESLILTDKNENPVLDRKETEIANLDSERLLEKSVQVENESKEKEAISTLTNSSIIKPVDALELLNNPLKTIEIQNQGISLNEYFPSKIKPIRYKPSYQIGLRTGFIADPNTSIKEAFGYSMGTFGRLNLKYFSLQSSIDLRLYKGNFDVYKRKEATKDGFGIITENYALIPSHLLYIDNSYHALFNLKRLTISTGVKISFLSSVYGKLVKESNSYSPNGSSLIVNRSTNVIKSAFIEKPGFKSVLAGFDVGLKYRISKNCQLFGEFTYVNSSIYSDSYNLKLNIQNQVESNSTTTSRIDPHMFLNFGIEYSIIKKYY